MRACLPCVLLLSLLACLPVLSPSARAAPSGSVTRAYTLSLSGKTMGERRVERLSANAWRYSFRFDDRGRGPDLTATLQLDARGIPQSMHTTGVSYFKTPVDDRFEVRGDRAVWKNANEDGSAPAGGFYLGLENAEGLEPLVQALLRAPDQVLQLLPGGTARLRLVLEQAVRDGTREQRLRLYAVEGLSFTPSYVWMDAAGDLFADGWTIRSGWESVRDTLDAVRTRAEARHLSELAAQLARSHGEPLLIRNARVFDTHSRSVRTGLDVLVADGRIAQVGPALEVPQDARTVDAAGGFLMPGLWDMHVHNFGGDAVGLEHLANGVTTVRDLAADPDAVVALRARWHSGETLGPRLILAGFIDGPGPYAGPTRVLVDTEAEARAAVDRYAAMGYEQIKLYNSLAKDLVPTLVEAARQQGLRVGGHVPNGLLASEAVDLGFGEIHHINHLFLNFMDRGIDTRTPARFVEVARHGAGLDLESGPVRAFIAGLARRKVVVDPTLALFESDWVARPGEIVQPMRPLAERLPPMVRRASLWSGLPVPEGFEQRYRDAFGKAMALVKALHGAGVPLVAGTDFMPGFALHRELELYAAAGIPSADVLHLATAGAAAVMGHRDSGAIAPGHLADLVLVDGDPLQRMSDIRKVRMVVRAGRLYRAADIRRSIGIAEAGDAR